MIASDVFQRHHLHVFRFLRRMTGSDVEAEDLTQDVFLRVVRGSARYEPREREKAWVFEIARNLLLNRHRDRGRRPETVPLHEGSKSAPGSAEDRAALEEALASLPSHEREAFLLRELGGLGYVEIAAVTDCTPDAVRSRIHRARMSLKSSLRGETS